jgi:ADP-heptose:LPS heptosyltransferase
MRGSIPILKRLEIAWRRMWIAALTRLVRRDARREPPDWSARPHRVLFLRHDRIGDMILSTGLLRVIARSHPTISIDVLASRANAPVLREDPHVDSVVVFDRAKSWRYLATVRRLRAARYDAVIDCMPTAPSLTTLLLILASGAEHRIGVAGRGNDAAFTLLVQPVRGARHIVDHLGALAAAFGVNPRRADFRPHVYLTEAERARADATWRAHSAHRDSRRILVNVSAGRRGHQWPDERFVTAVRHLRVRNPGLSIVVTGARHESARARRLAADAEVGFVDADLREVLALIDRADFVFTPNTSIAHAASAFRRPAVVMCPPELARLWGLYGSPGYELVSPHTTLESLPVEPVLEALDRLLGDDAGPGTRAAAGA